MKSFPTSRRWPKFLVILLISVAALLYLRPILKRKINILWITEPRDDTLAVTRVPDDVVPCIGPTGRSVNDDEQFLVYEAILPEPNPKPFAGRYDAINLPQTWTTGKARYAPYESTRSDIDWDHIKWGELQGRCIDSNSARFDQIPDSQTHFGRRLRKPLAGELSQSASEPKPKSTNGRTAIVLRSWDTFEYTDADKQNIRSIISETSLAYGGEYSVFLLVDAKRETGDIYSNENEYQNALEDTVPEEFRDIAILFDEDLLKAWYPGVREYRPVLQIFQPLQIFAHFYPEYEHFWQLEMDLRFSGHAGHLLQAAGLFSRHEPRKQAAQRTTFFCTETYKSYDSLIVAVNASLDGHDPYYTGIRIPEVPSPNGLKVNPPPTEDARDDDFKWGVGEDADCMLLDATLNVTLGEDFLFKSFVYNFTQGIDTPRLHSPPAMGRQSRNLLAAVHDAQRLQGLAIPGESTMPSFALYHGMKISFAPLPIYGQNQGAFGHGTYPTLDYWANAGPPLKENHGTGRGAAIYDRQFLTNATGLNDPHRYMGPSYRFGGTYPPDLWNAWMKGDPRDYNITVGKLPALKIWDDQVWLPNMIMHPVKTSIKRPESLEWIFQGGVPGSRKAHPSDGDVEGDDEAGSDEKEEDYIFNSKPDVVVIVDEVET